MALVLPGMACLEPLSSLLWFCCVETYCTNGDQVNWKLWEASRLHVPQTTMPPIPWAFLDFFFKTFFFLRDLGWQKAKKIQWLAIEQSIKSGSWEFSTLWIYFRLWPPPAVRGSQRSDCSFSWSCFETRHRRNQINTDQEKNHNQRREKNWAVGTADVPQSRHLAGQRTSRETETCWRHGQKSNLVSPEGWRLDLCGGRGNVAFCTGLCI